LLGIAYRTIAMHLAKKAGYRKTTTQTGAVTLIQRSGSAPNLNIHFHMLFLDGVTIEGTNGSPVRFCRLKAPTSAPNLPVPSPSPLPVFWSTNGCWSAMPRSALWPLRLKQTHPSVQLAATRAQAAG
jgi:hypothetical protein